MNKELKLFCADDWGMSPGINAGILELAKEDLLYSVSLMPKGPFFKSHLQELLELSSENRPLFFLHFDLTSFFNRSFFELFRLIMLGKVNQKTISDELEDQIKILHDNNVDVVGIDGHHHVQLIPIVCSCIIQKSSDLNLKKMRIMKDPEHLMTFMFSLVLLKIMNKKLHKLEIVECGYILNKDLFDKESFLRKINKYKKMIIHPAKFDDFHIAEFRDTLRSERVYEYEQIVRFMK